MSIIIGQLLSILSADVFRNKLHLLTKKSPKNMFFQVNTLSLLAFKASSTFSCLPLPFPLPWTEARPGRIWDLDAQKLLTTTAPGRKEVWMRDYEVRGSGHDTQHRICMHMRGRFSQYVLATDATFKTICSTGFQCTGNFSWQGANINLKHPSVKLWRARGNPFQLQIEIQQQQQQQQQLQLRLMAFIPHIGGNMPVYIGIGI